MKNTQRITKKIICNKYCIKYVSKIDELNAVIAYANSHKNGKMTKKSKFLHNTTLSISKKNEEKNLNSKRYSSYARGRAVAET